MTVSGSGPAISWDDATWILTSSFIVFTMQTGFALYESGCVQRKNEVSVMMKNCVDPVICGLIYWAIAYGLSVAGMEPDAVEGKYFGLGDFLVDSMDQQMGSLFAKFTFRLSTIAITSTIVSGAMAERITFRGWCVFAAMSTVGYSLPGYWIWSEKGFLRALRAVDISGCSCVHLVGGMAGLVTTIYLGPRLQRFDVKHGSSLMWATAVKTTGGQDDLFSRTILHSPTNALLGVLMLWWGWLGLNMGSTFGVSGHKWKYASRAAVATMMASSVGGTNGLVLSYFLKKKRLDIVMFIVGLLSSLVSISAGSTLYSPIEAIGVAFIGSALSIMSIGLLTKYEIDDPTGSVAIHLPSSVWGMVAVSLIVEKDTLLKLTYGQSGVIRGGSINFLVSQLVAVATIGLWTAVITLIMLTVTSKFVQLKKDPEDELAGGDLTEHGVDYKSNDDTLLPQSTTHILSLGLKPVGDLDPKLFARKNLRKVIQTMKSCHMDEGIMNESLMKTIKAQQVKNLALAWPLVIKRNQVRSISTIS
ncbi:putative ammonium transporter 3 [Halotydeus destructor]|nr:putative ammonium transporter 3 [Halotydeus destructor]